MMCSTLLVLVLSSFALKVVECALLTKLPRKQLGTLLATTGVIVSGWGVPVPAAHAGFFFPSAEQSALNDLATYQRPVNDLLDMLRPTTQVDPLGQYSVKQLLKDTKEDSDVVQNYLQNKIVPMQVKMKSLSSKLKLGSADDQKRLETLPLLMKGHMAELKQAINTISSKQEAQEVEEVQETLAEFLKLASTKYEVTPYIPIRPLSDKELYGPLGCGWWGKTRMPGSNACIKPEELNTAQERKEKEEKKDAPPPKAVAVEEG